MEAGLPLAGVYRPHFQVNKGHCMTIGRFLTRLRRTRKTVEWFLDNSDWIRGRVGYSSVCPITAVHGHKWAQDLYRDAGKALGLTERQIDLIADAADTDMNNSGMPAEHARLRRRLLAAVGL